MQAPKKNAPVESKEAKAAMSYRERYEQALHHPAKNKKVAKEITSIANGNQNKSKMNYINALSNNSNQNPKSNSPTLTTATKIKKDNINTNRTGTINNNDNNNNDNSNARRNHRRSLSAVLYDVKNDSYKPNKPNQNRGILNKPLLSTHNSHNTSKGRNKDQRARNQPNVTLSSNTGALTLIASENYSDNSNGNSKSRHQRSVTLSASTKKTPKQTHSNRPKQVSRVHDMAKLFGTNHDQRRSKSATRRPTSLQLPLSETNEESKGHR
ncbi:hypothetical protein RFI_19763 [Reticulomyxa filosa]|uniref:Uncharacterized protein n=1 Tax=Reticulomyxa filosa TaxID=46433 RepID=X6MV81_RETFI|nr:hypothetical protein RFI_19763 [Reticulomyxa filosa]|eukprot:ETO17556.1 hypothetical protein RFI_19763 [Reticulomyxa filosa]